MNQKKKKKSRQKFKKLCTFPGLTLSSHSWCNINSFQITWQVNSTLLLYTVITTNYKPYLIYHRHTHWYYFWNETVHILTRLKALTLVLYHPQFTLYHLLSLSDEDLTLPTFGELSTLLQYYSKFWLQKPYKFIFTCWMTYRENVLSKRWQF